MKIKFILVLATFLSYSISAAAQLPMQFSTNDIFSTRNKTAVNPIGGLLQNTAGNFNNFGESKVSTFNNGLPLNKLFAKCSDPDSAFAPQAAPCNGVSVTSINFNNAIRTVESGVDGTTGVIYRYTGAGTAPDGTVLDALVTVVSYSNTQDPTPTTFTEADVPVATTGFDQNLQPNINQTPAVHTLTVWTGSINYRIQFVATGTVTPRRISVAATTLDNDGAATCGTTLRESVILSPTPNQILLSTTPATTQSIAGNTVTGPTTNQPGIGIGSEYSNSALYINVTELNWTYSFTTAAACTTTGASPARYGSLNLSCQIDFIPDFASVSLSGTVFNDTNGLTDSTVNGAGTGTPSGVQLYANLLDSNGFVVSSVAVAAGGGYSFPNTVAGTYSIQISTNQGIESSPAPVLALPAGWVNTGEFIGTVAGNDGTVNGLLPVTVAAAAITNANFGIEQRPTAVSNTATPQTNPGGTTNALVPATTFNGADTAPGTVSNIRITAFPSNATTITINGTQYTSGTFPGGGVTVPTNAAGNPTQTILVDPINGAVTVGIPYVAIDNAGVPSAAPVTASVPFRLAPTAANGNISGTLYFNNNPIRNTLVVLIDSTSNSKAFVRTDANGNYLFEEQAVGRAYIVQPLSSKYSFSPANSVVNLVDNALGLNFNLAAKTYRPKNDFDGDGVSDVAVFRPSDGNWYVLKSSDQQVSSFRFGSSTDVPVAADYDGDGKTDYAVFRPSEGIWYIWQSNTQDLRAEQFGLGTDKLVPADYDGDGKTDIAVYRNGNWYVRRSSDGAFEAKNYGAATDTPVSGDFDGDGKSDFPVYRPADGIWYTLRSSNGTSSARVFGLATDVPSAGDFDGDGFADIAQFRNGFWYVLNSTTDFEASQFGSSEDQSIVGDYDGDGRADTTVFRDGLWSIRNSGSGTIRNEHFGFPTDIPVK